MAEPGASWLWRQRSSTRLGFMLQLACRVLTSLLALVWIPLLLGAMGDAVYGLFLSYQAVANLGVLGDLGLGGVVSIHTSRLLGQGKTDELRAFLGAARSLFLLLAVVATGVFLVLSPWLPGWLRFAPLPGAGSLPWLFAVGAVGVGLLIVRGYLTNLNLGCTNVTWPIVPSFLFMQLGMLCHWLLALQQVPLWVQYIPYLLVSFLGIVAGWIFVRWSHPPLAAVTPLLFDRRRFGSLLEKSFWVYLYCLGSGIYVTIGWLLINAGFGAKQVSLYVINTKLCELAMFVITSAAWVSTPKITQWLASPEAADRARAAQAAERLNRFQAFLGCAAALVYLGVNDVFMTLWLGPDYRVPLSWQAAFAANMAVTAAGYAGFDLVVRCSDHGIRVGGIIVTLSSLINLVLSFSAMRLGSILGIAWASVISQSVVVLVSGAYSYRHVGLSWTRLALRSWALAMGVVGLGYALRCVLPLGSGWNWVWLTAIGLAALGLVAAALGIRVADLRQEWVVLRSIFRR